MSSEFHPDVGYRHRFEECNSQYRYLFEINTEKFVLKYYLCTGNHSLLQSK